ncbi:MAG: PKD domain-containing protein, partial [Syntrophothermus sp.]
LYYLTWNFGDPQSGNNNISHAYNPAHTFTRTGHFTVMLAAMNSDGCTDSVYRDIEVNNPPVPMFSYVVNPTGMVEFTDQSTAGTGSIVSWEWNFGDGSAPVVIYAPGPGNINHQYNGGYYQVSLKVTNQQGCSSVYLKTIYLNIGITAAFDHTDSIVCARYPVIFHDHSAPHDMINRWRWYFGDSKDTTYTTYTPTLVHTFDVSGTYLVKLVISTVIDGSSISDTTEQIVIVNGTPEPQFTSIANCVNSPSQFNDVSGNAGIILAQREWDFGDPASGPANHSQVKNPTHQYATAGSYDVKLLLTNNAGCKDSLVHTVKVHAQPKASFENTLACSGNPTFFTDRSLQGDTTLHVWQWNFGVPGIKKDTSLEQNPVYYYKTSGTYPVRLLVRDNYGCYDTVDSTVNVFTSPVSAFRLVDNYEGKPGKILLNNESIGAEAFYWDFGNGYHSTDENPIVTYSDDGTYLIKLISYSDNECTDTTFYRYDMVFKGLYVPNAFAPTTNIPGVAEFKPVGINLQKYKIEVFDSWGHLLWQSDKIDGSGSPTEGWDGKDQTGRLMPQGTYMWKVTATFTDGSIWQGSDIGKGEYKSIGTVTLIR